jgi:hypothetical protein
MRFRTLLVLMVGLVLSSGRLALAAESELVAAAPPKAYTRGSESLDEGQARAQLLFGVVKTGGIATRIQFQFGLTKAYGRNAYDFEHPYGWNNGSKAEAEGLAGRLHPGTTYHYRLVAWNEAGKSFGEDRTFHTRSRKPDSRH